VGFSSFYLLKVSSSEIPLSFELCFGDLPQASFMFSHLKSLYFIVLVQVFTFLIKLIILIEYNCEFITLYGVTAISIYGNYLLFIFVPN
jgi:hypothetical protein